MSLPKGRLDTVKVELSGGEVEVRGLTLAQSRICGDLTGTDSAVAAIAFATGTATPDVKDWIATTSAGDVAKLLAAITDVSGLSEGAQFQK